MRSGRNSSRQRVEQRRLEARARRIDVARRGRQCRALPPFAHLRQALLARAAQHDWRRGALRARAVDRTARQFDAERCRARLRPLPQRRADPAVQVEHRDARRRVRDARAASVARDSACRSGSSCWNAAGPCTQACRVERTSARPRPGASPSARTACGRRPDGNAPTALRCPSRATAHAAPRGRPARSDRALTISVACAPATCRYASGKLACGGNVARSSATSSLTRAECTGQSWIGDQFVATHQAEPPARRLRPTAPCSVTRSR